MQNHDTVFMVNCINNKNYSTIVLYFCLKTYSTSFKDINRNRDYASVISLKYIFVCLLEHIKSHYSKMCCRGLVA